MAAAPRESDDFFTGAAAQVKNVLGLSIPQQMKSIFQRKDGIGGRIEVALYLEG